MNRILVTSGLVMCVGVAAPAAAQAVDLTLPGGSIFATNVGTERNLSIQPLVDFALTSVGIRMSPVSDAPFVLQAFLYSLSGPVGTRTLISSGSQAFTNLGLGFYDVPLLGSLTNGQFYDISLSPVGGFGFGNYSLEFFNFNNSSPSTGVVDGGVINVIDGGESEPANNTDPGFGNTVAPHLRLNGAAVTTTPEPASLTLLATGLVGVFGIARRARKQTHTT